MHRLQSSHIEYQLPTNTAVSSQELWKQEIFVLLHSWKALAIDRLAKGIISSQEFIEDITQYITIKQYQGKTVKELFLALQPDLAILFPKKELISPEQHRKEDKHIAYLQKTNSRQDLEEIQKLTENQFHRHISSGDLEGAVDSYEYMNTVNKALGSIGTK